MSNRVGHFPLKTWQLGLTGAQDAHSGTQVDGKPSALARIPPSHIGAAVGAAPGIIGSTPTQFKTESLKSIRDNLNSLLQGASPAEAHRFQKIINDLNAEIIVSVARSLAISLRSQISREQSLGISNGRMTDA